MTLCISTGNGSTCASLGWRLDSSCRSELGESGRSREAQLRLMESLRKSARRGRAAATALLLFPLWGTLLSTRSPPCQATAVRVSGDSPLRPPTSAPVAVRPGSRALQDFASRLATGSLTRTSEDGLLFEEKPKDGESCRQGASGAYPASVEAFLEACPVFYAVDSRGRMLVHFFAAENEQAVLRAQQEAAADLRRMFASSPPCALPALGVFFMNPRDAQVYIQHMAGADADCNLADGISLRAISLADAYPLLRYHNPRAREIASVARRERGGAWGGVRIPFLEKVKRFLTAEGLDLWRGREGCAVRCCLLPSLSSLGFAMQQQKRRHKGRFLGTPVFVLEPLRVSPASALHRVLTSQLKQKEGGREAGKPQDSQAYALQLCPLGSGFWGFRIWHKGVMRLPVFCSEVDLESAYRKLCSRLHGEGGSCSRWLAGLPQNPPARVLSLESVLNDISTSPPTSDRRGSPILLPSHECLKFKVAN